MNFADKLIKNITQKKTPVCVGLDPQIEYMPEYLKREFEVKNGDTKDAIGELFYKFNQDIIDEIYNLVPIVKLNIAFYEKYGWQGIRCFERSVQYAKSKNLLVLEDCKRNDLGHTAEAYAAGSLGEIKLIKKSVSGFGVDSMVVNPYMGSDSVQPFLNECQKFEKGLFVLVKTSNGGSQEIQDLETKNGKVYEVIESMSKKWGSEFIGDNGYSSIGIVVGATHPEQAKKIRKTSSTAIFLVPGYGAQGVGSENISNFFNDDGLGAIINNSRGICYAYLNDDKFTEKDYQKAAGNETLKMIKAIDKVLKKEKKIFY